MQEEKIISRGAEAEIILKDKVIIKNRIKKSYRHLELDEKLRKSRTKSEAKIMQKLFNKISVPKIIKTDEKNKKIFMGFISGKKLSEHLDNFSISRQKQICRKIGGEISKIHNLNIIHGDLTTSNMILVESHAGKRKDYCSPNKNKIFLIDFGLGFHSHRIEDKAVDLHLLKQALEAKHFKNWKILFSSVLSGYKAKNKQGVLEQLKKVELRGRYKH